MKSFQKMYYLLVLGLLGVANAMSCVQLDYIWQTNDCCKLQNQVPCLNSLPKLEYEQMVQDVDEKLKKMEAIVEATPKLLHKNLSNFCHDTKPIIGGVHYDKFTEFKWHNRPELYCEGNENRLVLIPQYYISNCYFEYSYGDMIWTAKIPFNPLMTIASYHQGTQSISKQGFCVRNGTVNDAMTISEINALVAAEGGVIYQTTSFDSHSVRYPCTDATQKVLGDVTKRVNQIPQCSIPFHPTTGQALNNAVDCQGAGGSFDHSLYVKMRSEWHTVDLHRELLLKNLYFTRYTGSTFLRYCLKSEYDNPINYVDGLDYGFDSTNGGHTVEIDN